jgi:glutathione synthase/RimK-type ligase-like ATP-grasp enzyme
MISCYRDEEIEGDPMPGTSTRPRVALVTCEAYPQLHEDERVLLSALAAAGADAQAAVWSDAAVAWSGFDLAVVRSTWDYFERVTEFKAWLARIEQEGVRLCNPVALVRWNMDKHYLKELEAGGVAIVPTRFVDAGEQLDVAQFLEERGWERAILKPALSGGAYRTHKFAADEAVELQGELEGIAASGGALLQPFVPEIVDEGEWSLLFFGGALSHAILKTPRGGDFRVQPQFGGTFKRVTPPPTMLAAATAIVRGLPAPATYVRVDGVRRGEQFLLMEVEAIEPFLFLPAAGPEAVDRYVAAVLAEARR